VQLWCSLYTEVQPIIAAGFFQTGCKGTSFF